MALAQAADFHAPLDAPDATATADNPLCGDRATVEVSLETPLAEMANGDRRIMAVAHRTRGCILCQAAANAMADAAPGHSAASVREVAGELRRMLAEDGTAPAGDWADLGVFAPVPPPQKPPYLRTVAVRCLERGPGSRRREALKRYRAGSAGKRSNRAACGRAFRSRVSRPGSRPASGNARPWRGWTRLPACRSRLPAPRRSRRRANSCRRRTRHPPRPRNRGQARRA